FIRRYHLKYGITMGFKGKVLGYIFFGRREYDEAFEDRELDFLRFLSSYSAMIITLARDFLKGV
ncbi:MAG: hypothetical protein OEZ36_14665, partial [Spirochaetota bacterium]|nr:hypothetical protein [Spirochaetota bacterium]